MNHFKFESMPVSELVRSPRNTMGIYLPSRGTTVSRAMQYINAMARRAGATIKQQTHILTNTKTFKGEGAIVVVVEARK